MRPMRLGMLWRIGLLGVAVAGGATGAGAGQALPGDDPAIEPAETADASPPALDLSIDPAQLLTRDLPAGPRRIDPEPADRYTGADEHASDRGLSFGLELKPRSQIGSLARQDDVEDPSLTDQLEKVIERPALSLRGRYRF
jgi:hypothetical protein